MSSAKILQRSIALVGNPNSGKTTLFNALTGLNQKTANYPGVTVEKKEGAFILPGSGESVSVLDLPGAYSLSTRSLDEEVVHHVIAGRQIGTAPPDLLVIIVDASNLERNLFFATQLIETGIPSVLALNMWDIVTGRGTLIDLAQLSLELQVPVIPTVGSSREGIHELKSVIEKQFQALRPAPAVGFQVPLSSPAEHAVHGLRALLEKKSGLSAGILRGEALRLLGDTQFRNVLFKEIPELKNAVIQCQEALSSEGIDGASLEAESRYGYVQNLCQRIIQTVKDAPVPFSEKMDSFLTHKFWGFFFFFALMAILFQAIFTWAAIPMDWLSGFVDHLGQWTGRLLPEGQLKSLVVDGIFAGVGGVVVFLPQIAILFFFIALFEDSGYMARAAFVLDRVMRKVGLNGKSFIPLLSSFACAVPAIMSTRSIEDRNDRFATILVSPLMSCSARLPVYALMISAFIPARRLFGVFNLQGVVLFSMYFLSILAGLTMAAIFRKTLLKGDKAPFVLELPAYRIPNLRTVFTTMFEKSKQFLYRAGTLIFTLSIILWFLASYPKPQAAHALLLEQTQAASQSLKGAALEERASALDHQYRSELIRGSFAGKMGQWIEPVIRPLGYDWKMGIGLIASFAAREVLVSTLAIVYNVGDAEDSNTKLIEKLQREISPVTGKPVYSPLVAISLMVFFVLACQCVSTVAIVKRETNSWRWPAFMVFYMTALAWFGAFAVFQIGSRMGF